MHMKTGLSIKEALMCSVRCDTSVGLACARRLTVDVTAKISVQGANQSIQDALCLAQQLEKLGGRHSTLAGE